MRARSWASFWTILAAVAGVVGAGAAVYPLLQSDQHAAHLTHDFDKKSFPYSRVHSVSVVTLSDPVVLTGRWYIRRAAWWSFGTLTTGTAVQIFRSRLDDRGHYRDEYHPLKDVRVPVNGLQLVSIDEDDIRQWAGGSLTTCDTGEFELGIEYTWKGGTSWARTVMPLCFTKKPPPR